jgi:D-lactate dehydrogenase (cytochrome)
MSVAQDHVRKKLPAEFLEALGSLFGKRLKLSEGIRLQHGLANPFRPRSCPMRWSCPFDRGSGRAGQAVRRAEVPIIPFGAGTSIEGNTPVRGGVTVDLSRDERDRRGQPEDFDCTVQAGVRREQLNAYLRDHRPVLPDRSRRQRHDRRHGLDPRLGHQRGPLRHDARGDPVAAVVTPDGRDIRTAGARASRPRATT